MAEKKFSYNFDRLNVDMIEEIATYHASKFDTVSYKGRIYHLLPLEHVRSEDKMLNEPIDLDSEDADNRIYYSYSSTELRSHLRNNDAAYCGDENSERRLLRCMEASSMRRIESLLPSAMPVFQGSDKKMYTIDPKTRKPKKYENVFTPFTLFNAKYITKLEKDNKNLVELMKTLNMWLGGTDSNPKVEDINRLLDVLATALDPHMNAGRYVIIKGPSRNGKSVLLGMLANIFNGSYSMVTRQMIDTLNTGITVLNHSLINIITDGGRDIIKNSSTEKQLISGEPVTLQEKYNNHLTTVNSNVLFIEALNEEPRTYDKTAAMQNRIMRFEFPIVFPENTAFRDKMLSRAMTDVLFTVLVNRLYKVDPDTFSQYTKAQERLAAEHAIDNSVVLNILADNPEIAKEILDTYSDPGKDLWLMGYLNKLYAQVAVRESYASMSRSTFTKEAGIIFNTQRRSRRVDGVTVKDYMVTEISNDTLKALHSIVYD